MHWRLSGSPRPRVGGGRRQVGQAPVGAQGSVKIADLSAGGNQHPRGGFTLRCHEIADRCSAQHDRSVNAGGADCQRAPVFCGLEVERGGSTRSTDSRRRKNRCGPAKLTARDTRATELMTAPTFRTTRSHDRPRSTVGRSPIGQPSPNGAALARVSGV
jgi:hypothetical protein